MVKNSAKDRPMFTTEAVEKSKNVPGPGVYEYKVRPGYDKQTGLKKQTGAVQMKNERKSYLVQEVAQKGKVPDVGIYDPKSSFK